MAQRTLKPETQAVKLAQVVTESEFTHVIAGTGILYFNSESLNNPILIANFGKAGQWVYKAVTDKSVDYFIRSFNRKYGKDKVPQDLVEYAFNQCSIDDRGRLILTLDFSENSLLRKYQNNKDVRITDDIVLQDNHFSKMQLSFFHLFNNLLSGKKVAFAVSLQYMKDNAKIPFNQIESIMKEISVL